MRRFFGLLLLLAILGPALTRPVSAQQGPDRPLALLAPGLRTEAEVERLRELLLKVSGVERVQARLSARMGARFRVLGAASEEALIGAARAGGFELRVIDLPRSGAGRLLFLIEGASEAADEEKVRATLGKVEGLREFRLRRTPRGLMLGVPMGGAGPEAIAAAVKAAGFEARPVFGGPDRPRGAAGGERNAPAARGERIQEDLTTVGALAPDFTLITKDGSGKISLSDYRGKKPVVLVFGSYT